MDPQKKHYTNSGIIYRNARQAANPKLPAYTGRLSAVCCHCQKETQFWVSADVKEGQKGKFFAVRIKPQDQQSSAKVEQQTRRGPANPPGAAKPASKPTPPPPTQPPEDDGEYRY